MTGQNAVDHNMLNCASRSTRIGVQGRLTLTSGACRSIGGRCGQPVMRALPGSWVISASSQHNLSPYANSLWSRKAMLGASKGTGWCWAQNSHHRQGPMSLRQHLPLWLSSVGTVGSPTRHQTLVCSSVTVCTMGLWNWSNHHRDHNTRLSINMQHG